MYLSLFLTFVACDLDQKPNTQVINNRILSGDFDAYDQLESCRCDSLKIDSLNTYFKDDSLYTGVCFLTHVNSDKKSELRQLFKGKLHGNRIEFSEKGDTISQSIYSFGKLKNRITDELINCHCDSLLETVNDEQESQMYYQEIPFTGSCHRFFPIPDTNKVYLEIQYLNGVIHGDMIFYDRKGNQILTEVYEKGEKVIQ